MEAVEEWRNGGGNPNSSTARAFLSRDGAISRQAFAHAPRVPALRRAVPARERSSPRGYEASRDGGEEMNRMIRENGASRATKHEPGDANGPG